MKKQSFYYGSAILIVSAVITKLIGAVLKIPLTNLLGGTGMACFSCAYGIFLPIYAVSVTGLPVAVARLVSERSALGEFDYVKSVKKIALRSFSLFGAVCAALVALLAYPFCFYIAKLPQALPAVLIIAPSILFGCVTSVYRGYYEGLHNMYPTALSQVAEAAVKLGAGLGLTYYVLNAAKENPDKLLAFLRNLGISGTLEEIIIPVSAAAAVLGVTLGSLGGMLFLIARYKLGKYDIPVVQTANPSKAKTDRALLKNLAATAVPVAVGSLVTSLTSLIDLATITRSLERAVLSSPQFFSSLGLNRDEAAGFFYGSFNGLAITIFNLVPSVVNMFGKSALPAISEAWTLGNKAKLKKGIENAVGAAAFLAVPAGMGIAVLSKEILSFLFSERTLEVMVSFPSLTALGAGIILLSLVTPVFAIYQAVGRADIPIKIMLAGVAVKLAGNLFLVPIPSLNITGAGISTSASYAVIFIISIVILPSIINVKPSILLSLINPIFSGAVCVFAANLLYHSLENNINPKLCLLVSIAISCCIYLISSLIIGYFARTFAFFKKNKKNSNFLLKKSKR